MAEERIDKLADVLVRYSTSVKPGDKVQIMGDAAAAPLIRAVYARVLQAGGLPLVNVWRAVQPLPNNGLQAPNNVYLTTDGWLEQNAAWLRTLDSVRKVIEE